MVALEDLLRLLFGNVLTLFGVFQFDLKGFLLLFQLVESSGSTLGEREGEGEGERGKEREREREKEREEWRFNNLILIYSVLGAWPPQLLL